MLFGAQCVCFRASIMVSFIFTHPFERDAVSLAVVSVESVDVDIDGTS